ncbi:MAG: hypothetical protein JNN32_08800 [Flavobacteriales bacterium]|nr:hypothetical protein [Flavobacteriales bacterium]
MHQGDPAGLGLSFPRRFWIYQKERFPLLGHGALIAVFTFSAIAYSRICRGQLGFIAWSDYLIGVAATITLFFLVRVFDEFKDREDDARYRSYLPVPRGLIALNELRRVGLVVATLQIAMIAWWQPRMLPLYGMVIGYLLVMGKEFFVPTWLKARQVLYITSHMVIIPLIDLYSSGLDWRLDHDQPHLGLLFFLAASYMNGIVLEFGRKLRAPGYEEEGVISYTALWGTRGGALAWLGTLATTFIIALAAAYFATLGIVVYALLIVAFVGCALPALCFLRTPTAKLSKRIEHASAAWTILMYLSLGGITMLIRLLGE